MLPTQWSQALAKNWLWLPEAQPHPDTTSQNPSLVVMAGLGGQWGAWDSLGHDSVAGAWVTAMGSTVTWG